MNKHYDLVISLSTHDEQTLWFSDITQWNNSKHVERNFYTVSPTKSLWKAKMTRILFVLVKQMLLGIIYDQTLQNWDFVTKNRNKIAIHL